MGKTIAKQAGIAVLESALRSVMPELLKTIEGINAQIHLLRGEMGERFAALEERIAKMEDRFIKVEDRIRLVERSVDQLRVEFNQELSDRTERLVAVMNELGQRITRVDQRLEDYTEFSRLNANKIDLWVERLVTVEQAQKNSSRRRAG